MAIITDISELHPDFQPGIRKYIALAKERLDIDLRCVESYRPLSTQMAYYSRGRAPIEVVQAYFKRCELWPISEKEAKEINTKTLYSKHIERLAADMAPFKDGKVWWGAPIATWEALFKIAEEECGIDACASGKWESWQWDWPHHEFKFKVSE